MSIKVENGIDSQQMKFLFPVPVSKSERIYADAESAQDSRWGAMVWGFPWVKSVTVGPSFILVSKQDWVSWDPILGPLKELFEEHLKKWGPLSEDSESEGPGEGSLAQELQSPLAKSIRDFLDREVNPSVAGHGGHIELIKIEGETVFIEMRGGCQGCGMAAQTLRLGVERNLLKRFPEIRGVVDITDHSRGLNPYVKGPGSR